METREERIALRDKQIAERDEKIGKWEAEYVDDLEKLPRRKIVVMMRELEITEEELEKFEFLAEGYGYRDAGAYLTDVLGLKWNNQDSFTLAEVLLTEINVLANE